jgi:mono/diheme cytochrome c family protein
MKDKQGHQVADRRGRTFRTRRLFRMRTALTGAAVCVLAWVGGVAATPATVAPASASTGTMSASDEIRRGEYLARAGDCVACHTADPARPFAGGLPIATPFGTIYTPNITPDPGTGIGKWTDAQFLRAMHEGIRADGKQLYPAFPYTEYTRVRDDDVHAIRAYLNSIAPVHYTPPENALKFPFNQRWLMMFWKWFNFDAGRFVPDPQKSVEWNRGAYLVKGLAHCEECHTPRNFMQGLSSKERFAGATQAGWHAFNITPHPIGGIGAWSDDELVRYLSHGVAPGRANAAGPMAQVVEDSTQYLSGDDLRAMVVYLRSVPAVSGGVTRRRDQWGQPASDVLAMRGTSVKGVDGAQLFVANCASCHGWSGEGTGASAPGAYPPLIHNSAVGATQADNLTQVVLRGVTRRTGDADVLMPAFGDHLSDEEIVALVNYVTRQFGDPNVRITAKQVAALRKAE